MTTPGTRPTVTPEDATRAQGVVLAWMQEDAPGEALTPRNLHTLRGLLIGAFADARHDAYADALADHKAASTEPPRCAICTGPHLHYAHFGGKPDDA